VTIVGPPDAYGLDPRGVGRARNSCPGRPPWSSCRRRRRQCFAFEELEHVYEERFEPTRGPLRAALGEREVVPGLPRRVALGPGAECGKPAARDRAAGWSF